MDDQLYGSMHSSANMVNPAAFNHVFDGFPATDMMLVSGSSGLSDDDASFFAEIQGLGSSTYTNNDSNNNNYNSGEEISIRAKIASHPLYPNLLQAYIDVQKVGAPPEVAKVLDEIRRESDVVSRRSTVVHTSCFGADPELDQFMETYCDILFKYKSDLSRPFDEATTFLTKIETQLANLCNDEVGGSTDEDLSGGELDVGHEHSRLNESRDLKEKLSRKYSGYISNLKHEFSKKKKKGKLPKEARQTLFDWWNVHYKWPYPTEADKVALAETTGLDQKQINNWFINQRKRHWKPSENMQYAVLDSLYGPFYMND